MGVNVHGQSRFRWIVLVKIQVSHSRTTYEILEKLHGRFYFKFRKSRRVKSFDSFVFLLLLTDDWFDVFNSYFHNFRSNFFNKEIEVYD